MTLPIYLKVMTRSVSARLARWALAAGALALTAPAFAIAQSSPRDIASAPGAESAPGQVLVRYEPGTTGRQRAEARDKVGARLRRSLILPRTELLSIGPGESVPRAAAELESLPGVELAEPNFIYRLAAEPADEFYEQGFLWNLSTINAPAAWSRATGSHDVVVGIVDGGVDLEHPDLAPNLWQNAQEAGGTEGVDDDGNLLLDDTAGWDWAAGDKDPSDEEGHGTHVAGIAGAVGSEEPDAAGVVGVNWSVSLMPLRACNRLGTCLNSNVAEAFFYAGAKGARIVNASISGTGLSGAQQLAISAFPNTLFVVAAGNDANDNDSSPRYPCSYTQANLICVAATTGQDELSSFSNYGGTAVDLAAPGGDLTTNGSVFSTYGMAATDPMNQTFSTAGPGPGGLVTGWHTAGANNTWKRTAEPSPLPGFTLTDSEGANYQPNTNSRARFGPVNLAGYSDCYLRYDLAMDIPDAPDGPESLGDYLSVEVSPDGVEFTSVQDWTGTGKATLTADIDAVVGDPDANPETNAHVRFVLQSDGDNVTGDGVHLDNIRIRCRDHSYKRLSGTSMASPHVAGAAALAVAAAQTANPPRPTPTASGLRALLMDGVDLKDSLAGLVASGGRLNLARVAAGAQGADIRRPNTRILSGPASPHRSPTATISFDSDEPNSTFRCSLNGAPFASCPSPATLNGLAVGEHLFRVRAIDQAGNEDATPAEYRFTVEIDPLVGHCSKLRKQLRKVKSARKRAKTAKAKKRLGKKQRKLKRQVKRVCVPAGL